MKVVMRESHAYPRSRSWSPFASGPTHTRPQSRSACRRSSASGTSSSGTTLKSKRMQPISLDRSDEGANGRIVGIELTEVPFELGWDRWLLDLDRNLLSLHGRCPVDLCDRRACEWLVLKLLEDVVRMASSELGGDERQNLGPRHRRRIVRERVERSPVRSREYGRLSRNLLSELDVADRVGPRGEKQVRTRGGGELGVSSGMDSQSSVRLDQAGDPSG